MSSLSLSALEKQLMDNIFALTGGGRAQGAAGLDEGAGEVPQLSVMSAFQQSQAMMVGYAFQDFVHYFMRLDTIARASAAQRADAAPPVSGPLVAAPLHLDLRVERYQQVASDELSGSQPVTVQKQQSDTGAASRIEIRTPELHSDGTVSYAVTVVKLAVNLADVVPQQFDPAHSQTVGLPPIAAASGTAGQNFQQFLDQPSYAGPAETLWEYETDDAMDLIEEQKRLDDWAADVHLRNLIEAAYKVLKYLQAQEIDAMFKLTQEERALVDQALSAPSDKVASKALLKFLKKKRVELEMARKEIHERQLAAQEAHKIAAAQDKLQRLINVFERLEQNLKQDKIDPKVLQGLLKDLDKVNLAADISPDFVVNTPSV